jgi:hypothetical protein
MSLSLFDRFLGFYIQYDTDDEYQQTILEVLQVKDIDQFDNKLFDEIHEKTREFPEWNELFFRYAAVFLSQDVLIGITVLFSYDYLALFQKALQCFFLRGNVLNVSLDELKRKIQN